MRIRVLRVEKKLITIQLKNGSNYTGKVTIPIPILSGDTINLIMGLLLISYMVTGLWIAHMIITLQLFFVVTIVMLALEYYVFRAVWQQVAAFASRYVVVRTLNKHIVEEGKLTLVRHESGFFHMVNGTMTGVVSHTKTYKQWDLGPGDSFGL